MVSLSNLGLYLEKETHHLKRREFFKGVSLAGAAAAFHFADDSMIRMSRQFGIRPDSTLTRDLQTIIHDITHPENLVVVMRNIVWELKCRDFFKEGFVPTDKIINVVGGSAHSFFDFFLRYPDFAKKYWH